MHYFHYKKNFLFCEDVSLKVIAQKVKTPCYIYSQKTLLKHLNAYRKALKKTEHLLCYSVKANSNLSILKILAHENIGFDIVSGGELFRVLKAGGDPKKTVFSGVGKTHDEMREALKHSVFCFNVESFEELQTLNQIAKNLGRRAPVSLRVNPDIDPKTHPYISTGLKENKFGIPIQKAITLYKDRASFPFIHFIGIDCHIGSQMLDLSPILETVRELKKIILELRQLGLKISHLNLGGGLGIPYSGETPPSPQEYISHILKEIKPLHLKLLLEPGRTIVGNAGILLTKVLYTKQMPSKKFIIVDAAMNDLIRPVLYNTHQEIWPIERKITDAEKVDVVGPICESADFFAKDRLLPKCAPGDLLAIMSSGAYGFSMSSQYNSRPRSAEVLVSEEKFKVCRRRESYEDLIRGES